MADSFLDRLGELEVPPPPERFDKELHEKVNHSLLGLQLVDLLVHAMPAAMFELARALVGAVSYSLTGRWEDERQQQREENE